MLTIRCPYRNDPCLTVNHNAFICIPCCYSGICAVCTHSSISFRLAFRLYLRLAMQGCVPAQRWVALMLDYGEGCRKDATTAARWYRTAAERGDAQSQNNLGVDYATGDGVPKDMVEAGDWQGITRLATEASALSA